MTDLTIRGELADQLSKIAEHEHRPLEEVLAAMVAQYKAAEGTPQHGLADEDIDVPGDIQDPVAYRAAVRQMRPKLYQIARRYWQAAGDQTRLQLSDAELDQVFWLIDAEGIPRLKSDQGSIPQPIDPLEALVGQIEEAPTDLSSSVRETMTAHYQAKAHDDRSA